MYTHSLSLALAFCLCPNQRCSFQGPLEWSFRRVIMSSVDSTLWEVTSYSRWLILFCKKIRSLKLTKERCVCVCVCVHTCACVCVCVCVCVAGLTLWGYGSAWGCLGQESLPTRRTHRSWKSSEFPLQNSLGLGQQVFTQPSPALSHISLVSHWSHVWNFILHQPICFSLSVLESWKREINGPALILLQTISSVQFSQSVVSDSLQPHGL